VQSVYITTKVMSSNSVHGEVYSIQHYVIKFVSDLRLVGGFLPSTPVSSTNKIDRHDIAEILLQVALNTIKPNQPVIYDHVYILGKPNTRHLFLCARQGNIFGAHGFFFLEYYKQSTLERCSGIIYIQ
jgi:hypothetical protein